MLQGDVESVSTKSPKELTALFEHISTSDELTKDYEELDSKREQAVQRTMFSYQKKKTTSGERKQKKEQKEEAEKHLALQEELVSAESSWRVAPVSLFTKLPWKKCPEVPQHTYLYLLVSHPDQGHHLLTCRIQ